MARDAYLTLLTLGRHAFEPTSSTTANASTDGRPVAQSTPPAEAPAPQPIPESRSRAFLESQRLLRKAQNDVVTTVGLQLHKPDGNHKSVQSAEEDRENNVGLFLGGLDLVTIYMATWPLTALRNELQTFGGLEDLRYRDVLLLMFRERSVVEWFAGMPADIVFQLINVLREFGQSLFFRWLRKKRPFKDPKTGKPRRRLLNILYKSITIAAWFWVYPIYRHSVLQTLHLVAPRPFFPSFTTLLPSRSSIPSSFSALLKSIMTPTNYIESYFFWSLLQQKLTFRIHLTFLNLFSSLLPRPDTAEIIATSSGGFAIGEADYDDFFSEEESETLPAVSIAAATRATDDSDDGVTQTFTATVQLEPSPAPGSIGGDATTNGIVAGTNGDAGNEISAAISEIEVQVTTTSTNDARPPRSSSLPIPNYRSTSLASHPSDVISSHASDALATALTVGLESMVMRTIAMGFLSQPQNASLLIPSSNLTSLAHRRGLLGLRGASPMPWVVADLRMRGRGVYRPMEVGSSWSLVFKALALEWGVAWGLFEVAYWMTTYVGQTWFAYR